MKITKLILFLFCDFSILHSIVAQKKEDALLFTIKNEVAIRIIKSFGKDDYKNTLVTIQPISMLLQ